MFKIKGYEINQLIGKKAEFQYSRFNHMTDSFEWIDSIGYIEGVTVKASYDGKEEYNFLKIKVKFNIVTSKNPFSGALHRDIDIARIYKIY